MDIPHDSIDTNKKSIFHKPQTPNCSFVPQRREKYNLKQQVCNTKY